LIAVYSSTFFIERHDGWGPCDGTWRGDRTANGSDDNTISILAIAHLYHSKDLGGKHREDVIY